MQQRKSKKSAGFGAVEIVIAVVVVLIVGFIGWRLFDASKAKQPASTQQTNGNQSDNTSNPQADATKYLDIKELGVKIKLDDKTEGATYVNAQTTNDEGVYIIDPTMKALDQNNQYCSGTTAGMIGLLDRSKDATHWGETPIQVDNVKSFKMGDYYYVFRGPQSECSQDSNVSAQRASHEQDFLGVLKTIQLDQ